MQFGFIGCGKMAQQMIQGFLKGGISPEEIGVTGGHFEKVQAYATSLNLTSFSSNIALVQEAEIIFLGFPAAFHGEVLREIAPFIRPEEQVIVSFLSGISLLELEQDLGPVAILRCLPNLNVGVNLGSIAICENQELTLEDKTYVLQLLKKLGTLYPIAEKDFSLFVALAGSAPAFVYLFIDALSRTAVDYGFSKEFAEDVATSMVAGSAEFLKESQKNPWALVDDVSSPGGSTVAGVLALQDHGFFKSIHEAMTATLKKDQQ